MASAIGQQHAAGDHLRAVALQRHVELVPRQIGAQFQIQTAIATVAGEHRLGARDHVRADRFSLHPGVAQTAARLEVGMQQMIGEVAVIADCAMMLNHSERRVFAQLQHVAQVADQFGLDRSTDEHQMQRGVDHRVRVHRDQRAVGGKSRVDAGEDVGDTIEAPAQHGNGARVVATQRLGEGVHLQADLQIVDLRQVGIHHAVDEHQSRRRDVGKQLVGNSCRVDRRRFVADMQ